MVVPRVKFVLLLCACLIAPTAIASTLSEDLAALERVLFPVEPTAIERALERHQPSLRQPGFVRAWYEQRGAQAMWTSASSIVNLRAALTTSEADGLLAGELLRENPDDPFDPDSPLTPAEREVLLTDTLVAFGHRLVNGRADARGLSPKAGTPVAWADAEPVVLDVLSDQMDRGELLQIIRDMRPKTELYRSLRTALQDELASDRDKTAIDSLRVNLERARWFERALGDRDRLVVNIPAYTMSVHLDGERVWQSKVIVGKQDRRTPVFVSEMRDIVLDPTWTVPRSIIKDSLFEHASADPAAFAARGFRLRDAEGQWRAPTELDWQRYDAEEFPYDVVQMPGEQNALGRVKFLFDNPYSVYLHDTPSRQLFDADDRAFSHGCVRVQDPDELARLVLDHSGGLDAQAVGSLFADADNLSVNLMEPLAVGLLYWTVDVDEHGALVHYDDIYDRDAVILQALDQFAPPPSLDRLSGS